jgi:hypothetical protein
MGKKQRKRDHEAHPLTVEHVAGCAVCIIAGKSERVGLTSLVVRPDPATGAGDAPTPGG